MEAFVFILVFVIIVAVVAAGVSKRETNLAWEQASKQLGLRCVKGHADAGPELFGKVRGCRVRVHTRGDGEYNHTRYQVSFPTQLGLDLLLTRSNRSEHGVRIRGRDRTAIKELLTDSTLRKIGSLLASLRGAVVEASGIKYEAQGIPDNPRDIVATVNKMVDVAQEISGYHISQMEAVRDDGYHAIESLVAAQADRADVESVEPESLDQTAHPEPEAKPESLEVLDEVAAVTAETSNGTEQCITVWRSAAADVCHAVFGVQRPHRETVEIFEGSYAGQTVDWPGRLVAAARYPFDTVFGNGPGTRATLHVFELDDPYGSRVVQAVAQLPVDALNHLRQQVGRQVQLTGTLVSCDPLLRVLFVSDAQIVVSDKPQHPARSGNDR